MDRNARHVRGSRTGAEMPQSWAEEETVLKVNGASSFLGLGSHWRRGVAYQWAVHHRVEFRPIDQKRYIWCVRRWGSRTVQKWFQ